jgi:hypothetical protein
VDIIQGPAVKNLCYLAAERMTPRGIVVHSTGANNPHLKRYVDCPQELGENPYGNHWNTPMPDGQKVCVHAFIGYDKNQAVRIAEILPLDVCCWGVGEGSNGSYNDDPPHIQFEICEDGLVNETYYQAAFGTAAEYCAYLCRKFGLTVGQIVSHKEAHERGFGSNHGDPEHWMKNFGEDMNDFRRRVAELLGGVNEEMENQINVGDLVAIADDAVYYDGGEIPPWVKSQRWYVANITNGDRAVIDKNESGTNSIRSPINTKYLTAPDNAAYLIKVTVPCLDIREDMGIESQITGSITDGGVYTIVDEKTDTSAQLWGRLKSGAGWILLDGVQKLPSQRHE